MWEGIRYSHSSVRCAALHHTTIEGVPCWCLKLRAHLLSVYRRTYLTMVDSMVRGARCFPQYGVHGELSLITPPPLRNPACITCAALKHISALSYETLPYVDLPALYERVGDPEDRSPHTAANYIAPTAREVLSESMHNSQGCTPAREREEH